MDPSPEDYINKFSPRDRSSSLLTNQMVSNPKALRQNRGVIYPTPHFFANLTKV